MARKIRSWEKGSFSSPVTSGGGKAVRSGTGSPVMSRSFSKPKAAPAAAKAAPKAAAKAAPKAAPKAAAKAAKTSAPRRSKPTTPKDKGPVGFHVGKGRPSVVPKNNKGNLPKQGPKDRPDIKRSLLNPLRSSKPLFSAGRARQEVGAMFRGRKKDGTPRR